MKIIWHSLTSLEESGTWEPYANELKRQLEVSSRDGTEFEFVGVPRDKHGDTYYSFAYLDQAATLENMLALRDRDDVDAVAAGNTFDPGVHEARELLDVPVLGLFETSLLVAHLGGERIGVVGVNQKVASMMRWQIRKYGLDERVVGAYGPSEELGYLAEAFVDEEVRETYVEFYADQVARAVDDGAEIVVPAGGLAPVLLRMENIDQLHGVPVVDKMSVLVKMTETMVDLYDLGAMDTSRKLMYRPPEDGLREELEAAYLDR